MIGGGLTKATRETLVVVVRKDGLLLWELPPNLFPVQSQKNKRIDLLTIKLWRSLTTTPARTASKQQ